MPNLRTLSLLAALSLGAVACTEPQTESSTATSTTTTSAASTSTEPATSASTSATSPASAADHAASHDHGTAGTALADLQGEAFDRAFLSMMIPHHEGAVAMSQPALKSDDPQVKAWAQDIVDTQEAEIAQMTAMLEPLGGIDEAAAEPMRSEMAAMEGHMGHAADPDRAFVEGMIPHHQSAIDMAELAEGRSDNAEVLSLARAIVAAQQQEIGEFEAYLKQ